MSLPAGCIDLDAGARLANVVAKGPIGGSPAWATMGTNSLETPAHLLPAPAYR